MSLYKVLIVEDEKPAREVIHHMVLQESKLFEVVGLAHNGRQGLELFEQHRPHIVITDITMPIMNGMELLSEINKAAANHANGKTPSSAYVQPQTIILSCHQDFHFAQQAVRSGAAGYLLKDDCLSDEELLMRTMKELLPSIENEQHMIEKQTQMETALRTNQIDLDRSMFLDILRGETERLPELLQEGERIEGSLMEQRKANIASGYRIFYIEMDRSSIRFPIEETEELKIWQFAGVNLLQELLSPYGWTKTIALDRGRFVSFCRTHTIPEQMTNQLSQAFQTYLKMNVFVFITSLPVPTDAQLAYLKALCKEQQLFFYEPLQFHSSAHVVLADYKSMPAEAILLWQQNLQEAWVQLSSSANQKQIWTQFLEHARMERWEPEQVKQVCRKAFQQAVKWTENDTSSGSFPSEQSGYSPPIRWDLDRILQAIANAQALMQIQHTIERALHEIKEHIQNSNPIHAAMKQLLERLENNLVEAVSLEQLAKEVDYSPTHFSFLFKKMTGVPLTQYIRNLRMDKAKQLLLNTDLKTFEIAEQVGIENYRHFNKLFKLHEGMSPTEFRRSWGS